jgi:hypothetical protein
VRDAVEHPARWRRGKAAAVGGLSIAEVADHAFDERELGQQLAQRAAHLRFGLEPAAAGAVRELDGEPAVLAHLAHEIGKALLGRRQLAGAAAPIRPVVQTRRCTPVRIDPVKALGAQAPGRKGDRLGRQRAFELHRRVRQRDGEALIGEALIGEAQPVRVDAQETQVGLHQDVIVLAIDSTPDNRDRLAAMQRTRAEQAFLDVIGTAAVGLLALQQDRRDRPVAVVGQHIELDQVRTAGARSRPADDRGRPRMVRSRTAARIPGRGRRIPQAPRRRRASRRRRRAPRTGRAPAATTGR